MVLLGWLLQRIPKGASRGLYAGKNIMHGHKITFSNKKSKRMWHPNVVKKTFYSEILGVHLRLRVTVAALRWIDKAGGFDSYIYHTSEKKLASELGVDLKNRMHAIVRNHPDNVAPPPLVRRVQQRRCHGLQYNPNIDDSLSNSSNIHSTSTSTSTLS